MNLDIEAIPKDDWDRIDHLIRQKVYCDREAFIRAAVAALVETNSPTRQSPIQFSINPGFGLTYTRYL